MRLQGGPLHVGTGVGWRCREHLVCVCVQPSGGAVDVPTIAAKTLRPHSVQTHTVSILLTPTVVTSFMRWLPLSGGYVFEVASNRRRRGLFRLKQVTRLALTMSALQDPHCRSALQIGKPVTRREGTTRLARHVARRVARLRDAPTHKARHHPTRPLGCGTRP